MKKQYHKISLSLYTGLNKQSSRFLHKETINKYMMNSQCISKLNICFQRLQRLFERPSLPTTQHYHGFSFFFLLLSQPFFFLLYYFSSFLLNSMSNLSVCKAQSFHGKTPPVYKNESLIIYHVTFFHHNFSFSVIYLFIFLQGCKRSSFLVLLSVLRSCKRRRFLFLCCAWGMIGQGRERRFFKDPWGGCLSPAPEPVPEREGTLIS